MKNDEQGYVVIAVKTDVIEPFHEVVKTYSFSWRGGKQCLVSTDILRNHDSNMISVPVDPQLGNVIRIGPYKIVITDIEEFRQMIRGHRVDSLFEYILWSGRLRLVNWLYMVYKIILFTGVVWKLVDYDPAVQTSWRDLKLLKIWKKK